MLFYNKLSIKPPSRPRISENHFWIYVRQGGLRDIIAYAHFNDAYVFIVETLEMIAYDLHKDKYDLPDFDDKWSPSNRSEAQSLLTGITNFRFIVIFMIMYQGLAELAPLTEQLQKRTLDIYDAYRKVGIFYSR